MKMACTMIDVHSETLTMEFDRNAICFNIFEAMRYPNDVNYYYHIDVVDSYVE